MGNINRRTKVPPTTPRPGSADASSLRLETRIRRKVKGAQSWRHTSRMRAALSDQDVSAFGWNGTRRSVVACLGPSCSVFCPQGFRALTNQANFPSSLSSSLNPTALSICSNDINGTETIGFHTVSFLLNTIHMLTAKNMVPSASGRYHHHGGGGSRISTIHPKSV